MKMLRLCTLLLIATLSLAQNTRTATLQERLGYPASARLLVIHADDVGMAHSVNRASLEALEKGWITSASILVPCPWFPEVARWAKAHPDADLGIHLALNSEWTGFRWAPLSPRDKVASLLDPQGYLPLETPEVAANAKSPEVEMELRAQIEKAQAAGVHITHLDTHMGALMRSPALFEVYRRMAHTYNLPALLERGTSHATPEGVSVPDEEVLLREVVEIGPGVPESDWMTWYQKALSSLQPGVYQMIVHLAYDDEEMRGATWDHPDWGAAWRQHDLDMVKSAAFQSFLKQQGFILVRWKDLAKALPADYSKR
jgi:predicted glycoside hydrolase/deacetylase ChbG (UPF0249 family)